MARPRHYHLITHLDEFVELDPKGLPARGEFLPNTLNLIKSEDAAPRTECPREVLLEARSRVLERGVPVPAVDGVDCSLDDLHVLLRHRPLSIPQAQESACAFCSDSPTAAIAPGAPRRW